MKFDNFITSGKTQKNSIATSSKFETLVPENLQP